jgi:hypothetical protein
MKKRKNRFFSLGMHIFQNFFILKYFLIDEVTNAKKFFWLAIFYRKIGPKMTFNFEDPGKPVDMTF